MSSRIGLQSKTRTLKQFVCAQCSSNSIVRNHVSRSYATSPASPTQQSSGLRPLAPGRKSSGLREVTQELQQATNNNDASSSSSSNTTTTPPPQQNTTTTSTDADNITTYLNNISLQLRNPTNNPNSFPISSPTPEPHHLHIFTHKHNIHITLTSPSKEPIISLSAGNIGFKHTQRGSFDAAYQLAAYVMRSIQEKGLLRKPNAPRLGGRQGQGEAVAAGMPQPIRKLEIIMRGFGQGREAAMKVLLGNEGRNLRGLVTRVSDSTRLKFGGTRSKGPRRL